MARKTGSAKSGSQNFPSGSGPPPFPQPKFQKVPFAPAFFTHSGVAKRSQDSLQVMRKATCPPRAIQRCAGVSMAAQL